MSDKDENRVEIHVEPMGQGVPVHDADDTIDDDGFEEVTA